MHDVDIYDIDYYLPWNDRLWPCAFEHFQPTFKYATEQLGLLYFDGRVNQEFEKRQYVQLNCSTCIFKISPLTTNIQTVVNFGQKNSLHYFCPLLCLG